MTFLSETRLSDIALVDMVWHARSERETPFISQAESRWEIVVSKYQGETTLAIRGPETQATPAECPADAEFFGVVFKLGSFMPDLPTSGRINRNDLILPTTSRRTFWLNGSSWEIPTFDNVDVFVNRLIQSGVLTVDPVVTTALQGQPPALSPRALQYRFLRATGLTQTTIQQIERARLASFLLQQGRSILDTVHETGYYDQPHLTRSFKRFFGQTPTQVSLSAGQPFSSQTILTGLLDPIP